MEAFNANMAVVRLSEYEKIKMTDNNNNSQNLELMTEEELVVFLRIPEVSGSQNYHNVIEHLKKVRGLPRVHMCHKVLYPRKAILEWLEKETDYGN